PRPTERDRYLGDLIQEVSQLSGLLVIGDRSERGLSDCYVAPRFVPLRASSGASAPHRDLRRLLPQHPYVLLCGSPGSGKSTSLQRLIYDLLATPQGNARPHPDYLPIWIKAKDLEVGETTPKGLLALLKS